MSQVYPVDKIRNIAIIAHVDHGKTTILDGLIRQTLDIRNLEAGDNLIMDSMDQERERGITIKAKNASIYYKDEYKINIVDTPGHADFGGEVERALKMVDGAILLVDAQEGPMPQTKYVMKKSIELGLKILIVVNKVDKPAANAAIALHKVEDLFLDLGANDEQMDFKVVYASGLQGKAGPKPDQLQENLFYFLDQVIAEIPAPSILPPLPEINNEFQLLVLNLQYDQFKGKMAVGKISRGTVTKNMTIQTLGADGQSKTGKVSALMSFDGLSVREIEEASAGEIVMIAGAAEFMIGDTLASTEMNDPLPRVEIDEPTVQMTFGVNTSPFSGKEGKLCTSRQIRERLFKELETNVSLRVQDHPEAAEKFIVSGRGELHLSVLIETMRREGFELEVSRPQVIYKEKDGKKLEPFESVEIDVPQDFQGVVMQELGKRGAEISDFRPNEADTEYHFEATMPTRTLIGLKSLLLSSTKGTVIMHTLFHSYQPLSGAKTERDHGSLVSTETGTSMAHALDNAQQRGVLFVGPATEVYTGMVIGQCARDEDLDLNPCKGKKLTNMRSSGADQTTALVPPQEMGLEQCLEYIGDDELVEVTPQNLRIRKRILNPDERRRASKGKK